MNLFFKLAYNFLLTLGLLVSWPYFLWRISRRGSPWPTLPERVGWYSIKTLQQLKDMRQPLWFHAVSVGEVRLAQAVVAELRKTEPHLDVVITTTTQTGRAVATPLEDRHTCILYSPLDIWPCMQKAFRLIRPSILILVEAEIWPNQICIAEKLKVPVCIMNARLSDRSENRYGKFRFFLRPLLEKLSWVALQFKEDEERFARAGFPPYKLMTLGSMKFDVAALLPQVDGGVEQIRGKLGWGENDFVLLGASTHPGEEDVLLEVYKNLRVSHPGLKLLIAPRHAERSGALYELCVSAGWKTVRKTALAEGTESPDIFMLDTTGEMGLAYSLATVVFVGKSLKGKGGQNFLEALRYHKPVIFGPHMQNFKTLANWFVREDAVMQVKDEKTLESTLQRLVENEALRKALSRTGWELFHSQLGTSARTVDFILQTRRAAVGQSQLPKNGRPSQPAAKSQ